MSNNDSYKNLRAWNGIMGVLHLVQGLVMWLISKDKTTDISLWLPKPDITQRAATLQMETWYSVNLGYIIASFLFLSAAAHFITILPKVYEWYIANLKNKINLIRWYEYALSSSVMVYVIAIECGIRDGLMLLLLVGVNACMNLFGAMMELHNSALRKVKALEEPDFDTEKGTFEPNWSAFVYGCFAGILPWIVMGIYFFVALNRLGQLNELPQQVKDVLNNVKLIFPALFIFFNLFAVNMILQYKQVGKWRDYVFGEKVYILLSLTAKSFLAWFVWGGTLR